jgi:hypothetical protein
MVTSMTIWPPVGGHPAMKVTIEVLFRRTDEGGTRKVGVRGTRLLFRLIFAFLAWPCCMLPFLSDYAGAGAGGV